MTDIDLIIKEAESLKPMPQVVNKIMALAEDPNSGMTEISDVIIYDQALTANILRICNSAFFGLPREVDSVHQAIVYMGLGQLVDIVLMSSGSENFNRSQKGYDLDRGELWKYSISSALIARELAEIKNIKDSHLIFTAALIKDIGKVVLSQYVEDAFEKIIGLVAEEGISFREAEKRVIGIDHSMLGGMVARKWKFSPKMISIIENHHNPDEKSDALLETSIVYLADTICMMMGIGVGADGLAYTFHRGVIERLGFTENDILEIMAGFGEKITKVEELIKMS
jgi:putative nucleotidyltransferase with HDIG domain